MSKYVAITGSSTGIGSSTVSKYLKEGYIVFGLDINKPEVTHNNFFHINCDISSVSSIKKARLEVDSFTKKVDHLVSNAGVHSFGSLKDLTEEKYEIIFNINVKGTLFFIQNFVTLIENNYGGSICLVGSDQSFVGKGSSVLYGATKGAIATITKSLAIDFASSNIRVNSVCPGTIETPLYHNAVKSNSHKLNMTNDDLYNILKTSQPIQRVGLPEEVSNVIYFLNSGEASFVTGSLYSVDGGYTAQ